MVEQLVGGEIAVEPVEAADVRCLVHPHRAGPKPALGIDLAVVETVVRQILLRVDDRRQVAAGQVESHEADARAEDQVAALRRDGQAGFFADVPSLVFAAGRVKAADAGTLDVHPDQVLRLRPPYGPLAKDGLGVQHTLCRQR